jgi:hypothetical protein
MDQNRVRKISGWNSRLISPDTARTKDRNQKPKRLPPLKEPRTTETSQAAGPAVLTPCYGPPALVSRQDGFPNGETPSNPAVPSFHPDSRHLQTVDNYMTTLGLPSVASTPLAYYDSGTDRDSVLPTGKNTGSHKFTQDTIDRTLHIYDPAAPAPFFYTSTFTNTPLGSLQFEHCPQFAEHPSVLPSLRQFPSPADALDPSQTSSVHLTAPHVLDSTPSASDRAVSQQSEVIDPDPYVYIDSLKSIHGGPFAYHCKEGAHTILAMNLEKLNAEYRIATRCVHYRSHTPGGWDAFNEPNGLCPTSSRDQRVERNQCFMDELAIEQGLPSPGDLKRVWKNSWDWASQEQSKHRRSRFMPRKDDSTNWDVPDRAFQLTAGCIQHHLRTTNPNSRIATVRRCKTPQTFDRLSSPDRVPVDDSFLPASRIDADQFALLTGDRPVTTSVPNLTVGSVNLRSA